MNDNKQYVIDDFSIRESWRIFRIISEFVDGFETMSEIYPAVSVFGSASIRENNPVYDLGRQVGRLLAENGFAVITGGGPGAMEGGHEMAVFGAELRPDSGILLVNLHYTETGSNSELHQRFFCR